MNHNPQKIPRVSPYEIWYKLLEHPLPGKPNLNQFHLSPCRAGKGEFQDYSLPERDHLTHLFRQIILNTGMVTLAAVVNRRAWNELVTGKVAEQLGDPVEMCFVKCIDLMIEIIRLRKSSEHVFIFFDEGTRSQLETWGRLYQVQAKKVSRDCGYCIRAGIQSSCLARRGYDRNRIISVCSGVAKKPREPGCQCSL